MFGFVSPGQRRSGVNGSLEKRSTLPRQAGSLDMKAGMPDTRAHGPECVPHDQEASMHLDPTSKISRSCSEAGAPPGKSTDPAIGGARLGGPAARRLESATAALAAAVLMFMNLGAGEARANDLSTLPCTAGDVEIVGSGIILNEPCSCPPGGTFNAVVQFTVRNNT